MANYQIIPWHRRPIGWHCCKVLCDIGWILRRWIGYGMYHHFLNIMWHRYKINYYGQLFT